MILGPPSAPLEAALRPRPQEQEICAGVISFIPSAVGVLWPEPNLLEERGLRNEEVKGDGKPGGTEAPLFGAQDSLGKGRAYALGRKGDSAGGGGQQLAGLLPLGRGGGQVPSRMPSGLTDRRGRAWRDASAEPKRVVGQGGNPCSTAPHPYPRLRGGELFKESAGSGFQSFLGTWLGAAPSPGAP